MQALVEGFEVMDLKLSQGWLEACMDSSILADYNNDNADYNNDNDSALQHNSKYNNNNDHNSEVNVYFIEGLPATCAGSQEVN